MAEQLFMQFDILHYAEKVNAAADFLRKAVSGFPKITIVIGSGLSGFLNEVSQKKEIGYSAIPKFPISTVRGHGGKFVFGSVGGVPVAVLAGRKHLYEGGAVRDAVFAIRVLGVLGVRILILSNAAGALNRNFVPGDLMLISDHINLMFRNPLIGPTIEKWGPRFPDMSEPYDGRLRQIARAVAIEEKIRLQEGIYAASTGPSYETRAEVEFLRFIGADAIGMSTVPENIVARQMGIRVLGITYISNSLVLNPDVKTTHEEVLANARLVEPKFATLIRGILQRLPDEWKKEVS